MEELRRSLAKVEALRVIEEDKIIAKQWTSNISKLTMLNHGLMVYIALLITYMVFR